MTLLLPALAFAFGSLFVCACALLFMRPASAIDRRLDELIIERSAPIEMPRRESALQLFKLVGEWLPRSPKEFGKLRQRLVASGYRQPEAVAAFFGMRAASALVLFGLLASPLLGRANMLMAVGGLGFGYIIPGVLLAKMAKRRQKRVLLAIADALDLMVISVEAGLGLDQAITRVADELKASHPDLADELRLVNLELRMGTDRSEALRNLADRTGVEDLSALVTMLIQTDKFGTSVAQSLRVFSDTLRTKRRQRAEEAAAKTGVKMVFPLVFCIFPAIWIVTIGPAAIKFITVLFPAVAQ